MVVLPNRDVDRKLARIAPAILAPVGITPHRRTWGWTPLGSWTPIILCSAGAAHYLGSPNQDPRRCPENVAAAQTPTLPPDPLHSPIFFPRHRPSRTRFWKRTASISPGSWQGPSLLFFIIGAKPFFIGAKPFFIGAKPWT